MAQILKEEVRNKIIESATREFMKNEFSGASMRTIAKNAGITVGNVYRYFENKEALFGSIIDEVLNKFNFIIKKYTDDQVDLISSPNKVYNGQRQLTSVETYMMASKIIGDLADLLDDYKDEIILLLVKSKGYKYKESKQDFAEWLEKLFESKYLYEANKERLTREDKIYIKSMSISFLEGLYVLINEYNSELKMKQLIEKYIQFFTLNK